MRNLISSASLMLLLCSSKITLASVLPSLLLQLNSSQCKQPRTRDRAELHCLNKFKELGFLLSLEYHLSHSDATLVVNWTHLWQWQYSSSLPCAPEGQNGLAQSTAVVIDFSCRLTEDKEGSFGHVFIPSLFIFPLSHTHRVKPNSNWSPIINVN